MPKTTGEDIEAADLEHCQRALESSFIADFGVEEIIKQGGLMLYERFLDGKIDGHQIDVVSSMVLDAVQVTQMKHDEKIPQTTYEEWREFRDDEPPAAPCDHWGNGGGYKVEQKTILIGVKSPRSPRKRLNRQLSLKKSKTSTQPEDKPLSLFSKSPTMTKSQKYRNGRLVNKKKMPRQVSLKDPDDQDHDYEYEDRCDGFRDIINLKHKRKTLKEKILIEEKMNRQIILANGKEFKSDPKRCKLTYDHHGKLIVYKDINADYLTPLQKNEHADYCLGKRFRRRKSSQETPHNLSRNESDRSSEESQKSLSSFDMDDISKPLASKGKEAQHCQPLSCLKPPLGTMVKLKPGVTLKNEVQNPKKRLSRRRKTRSRARKKVVEKRKDEYNQNLLVPGQSSNVVSTSGKGSSRQSSRSDVSSLSRPTSKLVAPKEPKIIEKNQEDEEIYRPLKDRILIKGDAANKTLCNESDTRARMKIRLKKTHSFYSTKIVKARNTYSNNRYNLGNSSQDPQRRRDAIGFKTENKFFHKRNGSKDSNYQTNSKERMSTTSFTRYARNTHGGANIKVFQRNTDLGVTNTNSSAKSLKRSFNKFDSFNRTILNNNHDLSHQKVKKGDIQMAFRPIRDPNVINSYHSITNPAHLKSTKIQSPSKYALLDDDYNESLGSPVLRSSYLHKLKTFSKLPRERLPHQLMKQKLRKVQLDHL
ncbi:unnamed protein product [Moneuplotes crassus]|uniref:Uncharacterized protein n=1 Tax=Euplotes crassus TaxID=5936 RepID=A0AAD2DBL8_EUPCR|nr:unnamed protein product [Moneuplotes crassus]